MVKLNVSSLGSIQETLMIPLYGRALESRKEKGILHDSKAENIVQRLNYNFAQFHDPGSMESLERTVRRTAITDRILKEVLLEHPAATVVELGCGLNTRFERTDNGRLTWFDLDLPDVHALWKHFFDETPRRQFLPFSAFDTTWMKQVKQKASRPYIFIAEASVIYFPEEMIRGLFQSLYAHFPGSYYLFDSATPEFLRSLEKSDALKYCSATLQWTLTNPTQIEEWVGEVRFVKRVDLESTDLEYKDLYPKLFTLRNSLKSRLQSDGNISKGYFLNLIKFSNS